MNARRAGIALVSGLVGYGAYYSYNGPKDGLNKQAGAHQGAFATPTYGHATTGIQRKAVIVGVDNIYTGAIPGNEPFQAETDAAGRKVLEMLTPDQATLKLRRNEESYLVGRGAGVLRYDVVQMPSNDPIEDDHAEQIIEIPVGSSSDVADDWMFWGVFDGHGYVCSVYKGTTNMSRGWTTSAKLRQALIGSVAQELNATYKSARENPSLLSPSAQAIETAIKAGFTKLDDEIVHQSVDKVLKAGSRRVAAETLAPALSGSCALLSFYESRSNLLRVACTGDSRAVLGRRGDKGRWVATPLSVDQTGSNVDEEARLRAEHPNEPGVVRNGRILGGLEPSRAFGDASYKWTRDISEKLKKSFFAKTPSTNLRTPPYVTAEPVVTTTKVNPDKGDFLVMATDGLWEMLTNEEVVGLVGQWIDSQRDVSAGASTSSTWSKMFSWQQKGLPVEHGAEEAAQGGKYGGQKTPIRQQQWGVKEGEDGRFVLEDKNVATHLVRNALGGKDRDMVCALLTLPAPFSRRYR